jgi:hypothetical protein
MPVDELDRDLQQHPKLASLLDLWNRKRGSRTMPARRDIDTVELREWLGNLILVDVVADNDEAYRYRVYGTKLADLFGYELTGKVVSHFASMRQPLVVGDYDRVRRDKTPVYFDRRGVARGDPVRIQTLALPLSATGAEVEMILAAVYVSPVKRSRQRAARPPARS